MRIYYRLDVQDSLSEHIVSGMHGQQARTLSHLMRRYGRSFSAELGLDLKREDPSELFVWLCAALLISAPIASATAMRAARALIDEGWTNAGALGRSTWAKRVEALNRAGYGRYDEKTATMLGELAMKVSKDYGGDLRELRAAALRDPERERALLKDFKGIGDVGAAIFLREVQLAWDELYPFADPRACAGARRLGLPDTAPALSRLVKRDDFPALLAALIRAVQAGEDAKSLGEREEKTPE